MDTAGKRLREWLTEIGITDPEKPRCTASVTVLHRGCALLFPMRACAKLSADGRTARRKRLLGKYGNKHGKGFPITMLKEAIDKIGF